MGHEIIKIKLFNALLVLLIAVQLVVSAGMIALMLTSSAGMFSSMGMVVSSAFLLLICLPISVYLFSSSPDRVIRRLFSGISAMFVLVSAGGIIGYVLPAFFPVPWIDSLSKVIMLTSYVPILYVLGATLWEQHKKLRLYLKAFIMFVNAALATLVLLLAVASLDQGSAFDIGVYTLSTMADIAIFAISSMLVLVYLPTKFRYIIALILTYDLFSFVGDTINLMALLHIYDLTRYSAMFYVCMLAFTCTALLLYMLANVKTITIEEINKKFDDAKLLMSGLVAQSPLGICICDTNGDIMTANEPFLRIFDKKAPDAVEKVNVFELADRLGDGIVSCFQRMRRGETVEEYGVRINLDANKEMYASLKMFSTYDSEGARSSFVIMIEDVTGRKRSEAELIDAKDQAELYIDLMGHDINNMNQVGMGYLELAVDTLNLYDDQRVLLLKPLEVMSSSSQLIDNVRKMRAAKMESGDLRRIDLEQVLSAVVKNYEISPGRDFIIKYEMVEKCYVMADDLLKDVFLNILNNAVKHSTGPLLVRVELAPVFEYGLKYYRVTIEDNGPGIPEDLKPYIFDRAYRSKVKAGYSGLGLCLVKTLVDKYHGTISAEDRVQGDRKQGSRFIVKLPEAA
jgi:PAS domain S-box-containing protein